MTSIKTNPLTFILGIVTSLVLLSCSQGDEPATDNPSQAVSRSIELTPPEKDALLASNRFAWRLFKECLSQEEANSDLGKGNVSLSPMSASICLSMLTNGAAGQSQEQLMQALGFEGLDIAQVNGLNNKLTSEICSLDDNVTVSMANSIWVTPQIKIKQNFLRDLLKSYQIEAFDIKRGHFAQDINAWCKEKTHGLITKIVEDGFDTDLALANALYFKGIWNSDYKFDKKNTQKGDFENADGTVSRVDYMSKEYYFSHHSTEQWSAIWIPFGGGAYSYTVILPSKGYSIDDCLESISEFEPATSRFGTKLLQVKMPKFNISLETNLVEVLKNMGVSDIFVPSKADFSNMTETSMVVDLIKQSVSFEVSEEGAEAAAVTMVGMLATSVGPATEPEPFIVDRPFIYMISERSTGAILFLGCMNKF